MTTLAENPWVLTAVALVLWAVVGTLRAAFPDQTRPWLFLVPLATVVAGWALDAAIQTPREAVRQTVRQAFRAFKASDVAALGRQIAPDYRDSSHPTRLALLHHAEEALTRSTPTRARVVSLRVSELTANQASVRVTVGLSFTEDSFVSRHYRDALMLDASVKLAPRAADRWLITSIEVQAVDMRPVQWGTIEGHY